MINMRFASKGYGGKKNIEGRRNIEGGVQLNKTGH